MAKADFVNATNLFPSVGMNDAEWRAFFDTPAGMYALGRILYDIYDKVVDEEEKANGLVRKGRRPARKEVPLEEVYRKVLPPAPSLLPFPEALKEVMNGKSLRWLAPKIPIDVSTLSRVLRSKSTPDIVLLERIAAAVKVHPGYFLEWRALYIGQLITEVYLASPNLSIASHRALRAGKQALAEGRIAS